MYPLLRPATPTMLVTVAAILAEDVQMSMLIDCLEAKV
jgi:hypothetical protein